MAYSEAHNKANQRYQAKVYDRLYVRVRKGKKEAYEKLAKQRKTSLASLIISLLDDALESSGIIPGQAAGQIEQEAGDMEPDTE